MKARTLMVQGSASSVGKSLITAALCRIYARRGFVVAPYKSQNMSNNAAALREGGEIGRAQALQAMAARVEARVEMNPILLKPEGDARSQVVLLGKPWKTLAASDYYRERDLLWEAASGALDRLREDFELVVIEGAGSAAELNLRDDEIVNMRVARYANSPVLLVGDIDSGGIFAQLIGTLDLLEPEERALVRALVVNKFRGDFSLFASGVRELEKRSGLPVLGVVPYMRDLALAEEDGAVLEGSRARGTSKGPRGEEGRIDIAVLRLPRISNFDDYDTLALESKVSLRFVSEPGELGRPDAIIVPGTKATLADLDWLRERGFDEGLRWLSRAGVAIFGICGGFQMLGASIEDPDGVEGPPRIEKGLGLLPIVTTFTKGKRVAPRRGFVAGGLPGALAAASGEPVEGYEIHAGESRVDGPPLLELFTGEGSSAPVPEGSWSAGGRIIGTYLHGIFDLGAFRRAWLASIAPGPGFGYPFSDLALSAARESALDRLADGVEASLDMEVLDRIVGLSKHRKEGL